MATYENEGDLLPFSLSDLAALSGWFAGKHAVVPAE